VAVTAIAAYLPFLGAGSAVFGFLPGYLREEDLASGFGFFLWSLLESVAPPLREIGVAPYLALAAASVLALALYAVLRERAADHYIASATTLAVLTTVLMSPHYAWYFAWLVPFLCFAPHPSVLYLTVASPLLYFGPGGPDPDGVRMPYEAAVYGPFAAFACLELCRRIAARAGASWIGAQA